MSPIEILAGMAIGMLSTGLCFALFWLTEQWVTLKGWRAAFRRVFNEWADSCDWAGYPEIPQAMYENLKDRLDRSVRMRGQWMPGDQYCLACGSRFDFGDTTPAGERRE